MRPPEPFGTFGDGRRASLYTLAGGELRVRVTDYGGRVVAIELRDGVDVLLGFDDVRQYALAGGSFGALLGRTANRIAGGEFEIDGRRYKLPTNDRGATLHGGPRGFDKVLWNVTAAAEETLTLAYTSPDGDQGFPGELVVEARYRICGMTLGLEFTARTTKPTLCSLSAHPYFNLGGAAARDVLGHEVTIAADAFLAIDDKEIPTGEICPVDGTVFDFRRPEVVGEHIRKADPQLLHGQGYDHYYVLGPGVGQGPRIGARARDPQSGRFVEVWTTHPGLQFYTGNQLDASIAGRGGLIYRQSAGLAFEPQGFPDAAHHANFPSTVLRPGELYRQLIEYRFGIE